MIYDCIVLGVGGIGSSALYAAAQRGWKVLGIDRFGGAHDKGSSHGRTRIIRTAYFEHPDYVPLAQRCWERWEQIQAKSDVKLVEKTGLLQVGDPEGEVYQGLLASATQHNLAIEQLSAQQAMQRFPAFTIDDTQQCIYEEAAGFLLIENCVAKLIQLAKQTGAEFASNTHVQSVSVNTDGTIKLKAGNDEYLAHRLVVAAGSWSSEILGGLPFEIQVVRKQQTWFQVDRVDVKYQNGFPAFLFEEDNGCFYGFPEIDYLGMKVAEHSGGQDVEDPSKLDRQCNNEDLDRTQQFIDRRFNISRRRLVHHSVCMYSMSRDGHFIIDHHPDSQRIVFAAGLSGHGFKFSPVIGQQLVDLLEGESDPLFEFLKIGDRQLTGAFPG